MSAHLQPTMGFGQAMNLMRQGKKVARKEWWTVLSGGRLSFQDHYGDGPCVYLLNEQVVFKDKDGNVKEYEYSLDDIYYEDWIEA